MVESDGDSWVGGVDSAVVSVLCVMVFFSSSSASADTSWTEDSD